MSDLKLRGPRGCADTLNFGGKDYVAEKGVFTVPQEAHAHLSRHGFVVHVPKDEKPKDDAP